MRLCLPVGRDTHQQVPAWKSVCLHTDAHTCAPSRDCEEGVSLEASPCGGVFPAQKPCWLREAAGWASVWPAPCRNQGLLLPMTLLLHKINAGQRE